MRFIFFTLFLFYFYTYCALDEDEAGRNRIIIKMDTRFSKSVEIELYKFGWIFKEMLTPNLYTCILEMVGSRNVAIDRFYLEILHNATDGKIEDIELITLHVNAIQRDPEPVIAMSYNDHYEQVEVDYDTDYGQDNNNPSEVEQYYGMGILEAWDIGYSGDGVVIAVSDVGVDVDHPGLKENINKDLSFNFVGGHHVYPERFPNNPETLSFTDHGNRCCGLIAALKTNPICNVGIAYRASIAVLKIFKVSNTQGGRISFLSDTILKALIHRIQEIDIYSNSWTVNEPFAGLTFSSKEVLSYGIKTGRQGQGSIYVFPVGQVAEGYTNSKYTIAVNSIGVNGRVPGYSELCACVLTSAFGEGVHLNSTTIKTTSHSHEKCTRDFKGTSASTAMVSAMVALALQSNAKLTWRDIQHIIVKASDHEGMYESGEFIQNGAEHYFHPYFGFGLLNATKLVTFAKTWTNVPEDATQMNKSYNIKRLKHHKHTQIASGEIVLTCDDDCESTCVDTIEHVEVKLSYMTPDEKNLKITLTSPSRTHSVLMNRWQSYAGDILRQEALFLSVNFWGENPTGTWILKLHQHGRETETSEHLARFGILYLSLSISGTCIQRSTRKREIPISNTTKAVNIEDNRLWKVTTDIVTSTANKNYYKANVINIFDLLLATPAWNKTLGIVVCMCYSYIYYKKMIKLMLIDEL